MERDGEGVIARVTRKTVEEHICICRGCAGTGQVGGETCRLCCGSGRVMVMSSVTTYVRPYVPEN